MTARDRSAEPLIVMRLRVGTDIFVVRQLAREVARVVGLETQDQTRLATALSEVARFSLAGGRDADVAFLARPDGAPTLWVEVAHQAPGRGGPPGAELALVGRLVDTLEIVDGATGTVIRMSRRLPSGAPSLTPGRMDDLRAQLSAHVPGTPLDELGVQNHQLIAALDEVRTRRDELAKQRDELAGRRDELAGQRDELAEQRDELARQRDELARQRDELARLNAELQATNHGVMALYNQLSEELEETNRGVVALYAELDEKSAQLRAASEAKSRFLANVSHELRAPVTAIIGLGRLLTDSSSDPLTPDQARQVELIRGSANDLLALVNDLLDLAKAEAGRIEPTWSTVDLRAVFGQLRGTLRALSTRPEVDFVVDDPEPRRLCSDEVLLARVLRNLLTNALKFTERGTVRLTSHFAADGVDLVVSDTGVGIPAELQDRIFEEFYQVPGGLAGRATGTGLGLPYARRLVDILGGRLTVDSEPGRGSVFTVHLPIAPPVPTGDGG